MKHALCLLAPALIAALSAPSAENPPPPARIETACFRFTLSGADGRCEILDKQANVTWRAEANQARFGQVTLATATQSRRVDLARCVVAAAGNELVASFQPLSAQPANLLRVRARALADQRTLELSYQEDNELEVANITLLEDVLGVTDSAKGYVVVPAREGLLVPADSGLSFTHRFDTYAYEGCHMAMLGVVQNGAAALVTWRDPYVAAELKSVVRGAGANEAEGVAGGASRQRLSPSLVLSKSARSFRITFLGRGDYVTIAKAYRQVAREGGWLVTWDQKLKSNPERAKLFGAANIKLWSALDRRMNQESTREQSVRVNWTFAEAAQVAEHLKRDLKLDRVLFTLGGWIHRGYDNQHPDILPTAPECGGDAAFADCARRVRKLGYLFCLHDNYQDIYRDSPSWNEKFVMKTGDGQLARGGHWAGGLAYLTCSQMALELAKRPQNLPAVKKLSGANAYFIDTTYAAGLQECFDPAHPLTRADDIKWKQALSDYARQVFGVFGSECGREWAIPHSDFFEGLTGVSGGYYHDAGLTGKLGATVVPLFELVYRDCIAIYGKYGYDPQRAAGYVLYHISLGRPINYHSIPPHLYWKGAADRDRTLALRPGVAQVEPAAPRRFRIAYRWTVERPPTNDWTVFVHFTDPAGDIKFQNDHEPRPATTEWQAGEVRQGPFEVTVPEGLTGTFNVRMGLFRPADGQRALLQGRDNGERSYLVGRLKVTPETIEFQSQSQAAPTPASGDPALFTRAEGGWAEGLHPVDRFIKNTCEVLSPLNELTARLPLNRHQFLTPDRKVQRTVFGEGPSAVETIVNAGGTPYTCASKLGGQVALPPGGFLVESPTFVAFHASNWAGTQYDSPPLFTLRSLDQRPLSESRRIRVYHAFGSNQLSLGKTTHAVRTEAVLDPQAPGKAED